MTRTEITPTALTRDGVSQTPTVGTADGNKFTNDGRTWVEVTNSDGVNDRDITFVSPQLVNGLAVADQVATIPAGETKRCGLFPKSTFNLATGEDDAGMCYINYDTGNEGDLSVQIYYIERSDIVL